jgi:isopentenyl-diphosphate Delta-isomerase
MELFDIYNQDGAPAGYTASRDDAHRLGLWHRTVHVWILNGNGELLLQKRALTKDVYPGYWDISCAGHIDAGESPETAALRELSEELGVQKTEIDLAFLFTVRQLYDSVNPCICDREHTCVFLIQCDLPLDAYRGGNDEVTDVQFVKPGDLTNGSIQKLADHPDEYVKLQKYLVNVKR